MHRRAASLLLLVLPLELAGLPLGLVTAEQDSPAVDPEHAAKMVRGRELFKKSVRAILTGRCLKCHGGEATEGEFSLATRKTLLAGGATGKAVVPGKPSDSLLVQLITHEDEPKMPEDGAKLSAIAIDQITKWIELGAPYDKPLVAADDDDPEAWTRRKIDDSRRDFWSFLPLRESDAPELADDQWSRSPIDRFVLAKQREQGLTPNGMADRRVLIRRAYFDLTGLPPSPAAIERFIADPEPRAYEKLIDHLLASKHYGERWGRHWLDVARFGESHGFEQDYDRPHAYHYRDFVIQALNNDMPFDQFVRWQLAGDEIAPTDPLAMMATGFLGAGVFPTQLTEKEFESARYDELDDIAATVGTAMLGLTIGCARCHDHKFDPIPAADYYRFISTFRTAIRSEVQLDLAADQTRSALAEWQREHAPLVAAVKAFENEALDARFDDWLANRPPQPFPSGTWITLDLTEYRSKGGATLTKLADGSLLATGTNPDFDTYTLVGQTHFKDIRAIRIEALAHESMTRGGPGRASNGNMGLGTLTVAAAPLDANAEPTRLKLVKPRATFQQNGGNLAIAAALDGNPNSGWAVDPQFGKDHAAVFEVEEPVGFDKGVELTITLDFQVNNKHNIGRPRISICVGDVPELTDDGVPQNEVELLALVDCGDERLEGAAREQALHWYRGVDAEGRRLSQAVQNHLAKKPEPQLTTVMIVTEGRKPIKHHADGRGFPHFYPTTYFLKRGDANQKLGEATDSYLQVLMRSDGETEPEMLWRQSPAEDAKTSYRRRSMAEWMTDDQRGAGHLLARVIVNRLWQHHFGRGIVSTPNDFGFQGERPTHPELLDWLAAQLITNDWRLKSLHKQIMTSAVYMQASAFDNKRALIDQDNQWLWRRSPQRLQAEIIRDTMLTVSGELDDTMFGPGTLDAGMRRRSIYFMIKRSRLVPMMQIFDAPEPLVSVGDRPTTTIAPQALMFLNGSQVRRYATSFAKRIQPAEGESVEHVVRDGYLHAVGRPPTQREAEAAVTFIEQQRASYQDDLVDSAEDLALVDFCQVLLGLNEFVYVE